MLFITPEFKNKILLLLPQYNLFKMGEKTFYQLLNHFKKKCFL